MTTQLIPFLSGGASDSGRHALSTEALHASGGGARVRSVALSGGVTTITVEHTPASDAAQRGPGAQNVVSGPQGGPDMLTVADLLSARIDIAEEVVGLDVWQYGVRRTVTRWHADSEHVGFDVLPGHIGITEEGWMDAGDAVLVDQREALRLLRQACGLSS